MVSLTAQSGEARGQAFIKIRSEAPTEPVIPLIGKRAITADRAHYSMAVVIPFDRYANPVEDSTPIFVQALHPGEELETRQIATHYLLAWLRIYSRTKAGRTIISIQTGNVHGPDGILDELAGWPKPFNVTADPATLPADGRLLTTIRSEAILDRFGNEMPDGTLITFVVDLPGKQHETIPAYTIQGIAEAQLQAPILPGTATIHAEVLGAESRPLSIIFTPGPAVQSIPIAISTDAKNKAYILNAGPIVGSLNQYIPDGTTVTFRITNARGQSQTYTGISDSGYAIALVRMADLPPGKYKIEARAGSGYGTRTITFP